MSTEENKETLSDSWLKKLKNKPVVAALIVIAAAVPAVVSFGESAQKLLALLGIHENVEQKEIATESNKPDYAHHRFLVDTNLLHPVLREKAAALIAEAQKNGINLQYYETYRGPALQKQMFDKKEESENSTAMIDTPWSNLKQFGLSVTLVPFGNNGWVKKPQPGLLQRLNQLANSFGLISVGTQNDPTFKQLTFTLPNLDLEQIKQGHFPAGGDELWASNLNNQIDAWGNQIPAAPAKFLAEKTAGN